MSTFVHFAFLKIPVSKYFTQSDLEKRILNIFSKFLMLRKAVIILPNVGSKPGPLSMARPLELRGTFLELFF